MKIKCLAFLLVAIMSADCAYAESTSDAKIDAEKSSAGGTCWGFNAKYKHNSNYTIMATCCRSACTVGYECKKSCKSSMRSKIDTKYPQYLINCSGKLHDSRGNTRTCNALLGTERGIGI